MLGKIKYLLFILGGLALLSACGDDSSSFSLLSEDDTFFSTSTTNTKIDVLWVVDNSGSMFTSQDQLTQNFQSFIQGFSAKGFDFQISVTTTEAWKAEFSGDPSDAELKDGTDATSHTGVFVINPLTPNLNDVFLTNAMQGTDGSGNERAFQSIRATMDSSANAGYNFYRSDAFLAVIIVSDEDDFSHDTNSFIEDYTYPGLHSAELYRDYLDTQTGSSADFRSYSVSAMAIFDEDCKDDLTQSWPGRKLATRYAELVDLTGGVKGSLCDDFATTLEAISTNILVQASAFQLSRIPIPESISVVVNGSVVPHCFVDTQTSQTTPLANPPITEPNPAGCGYTFEPGSNSIVFTPSYIPAQGAAISVNYDPVQYGQ